jgi:hypothetical protein
LEEKNPEVVLAHAPRLVEGVRYRDDCSYLGNNRTITAG